MDTQNTVVVGVDGSAPARAALVFAYRDAARRAVPLQVVAVYSPPEYTQVWLGTVVGAGAQAEIAAEARRIATAMVEDVRAALAAEPAPPAVEVVVVGGVPARTLVGLAAGADLLVIGSRGHGGFASVMLGSVSLWCVMHARCPVTVVHAAPVAAEESQDDEPAGAVAYDPLMSVPML